VEDLPPGLYDTLVDELLHGRIGRLNTDRLRAGLAEVEPADLPARVGELVRDPLRRAPFGATIADHLAARSSPAGRRVRRLSGCRRM